MEGRTGDEDGRGCPATLRPRPSTLTDGEPLPLRLAGLDVGRRVGARRDVETPGADLPEEDQVSRAPSRSSPDTRTGPDPPSVSTAVSLSREIPAGTRRFGEDPKPFMSPPRSPTTTPYHKLRWRNPGVKGRVPPKTRVSDLLHPIPLFDSRSPVTRLHLRLLDPGDSRPLPGVTGERGCGGRDPNTGPLHDSLRCVTKDRPDSENYNPSGGPGEVSHPLQGSDKGRAEGRHGVKTEPSKPRWSSGEGQGSKETGTHGRTRVGDRRWWGFGTRWRRTGR